MRKAIIRAVLLAASVASLSAAFWVISQMFEPTTWWIFPLLASLNLLAAYLFAEGTKEH